EKNLQCSVASPLCIFKPINVVNRVSKMYASIQGASDRQNVIYQAIARRLVTKLSYAEKIR
ncbi:MAG TPA: hypothetical protein VGB67_04335, partial [Fibrella sp.]